MKTEVKQVEVVQDEKEIKVQMDLETALRKLFVNKDIMKEMKEENTLLTELIEERFEEMNGTEMIIELPSGEFGKVFKKPRISEKLDKDLLVEKININSTDEQPYVSKDDLKTPWDFSMLTKQERITPKMIAECTNTETTLQTKIAKVKRKPKKKKDE